MSNGDNVDHSNDEIRRQIRLSDAEHRRSLPVVRRVLDRLWDDDRFTDRQRADAVLGAVHRRRFIALGGATVLTSAFLAACGSKGGSGKGGSGAAASDTTTTTAPTSTKDLNILRAASSLEHVAVTAYQKAIDSGLLKTEAVTAAATAFQSQHKDHAQLFENATSSAGGEPYTQPNPVLMSQLVTPRLAVVKTETDVIQLAYDLERLAASTYQADVGAFDDLSFNQLIMSVGGIEARHVAVLAPLAGKQPTPDGAFQTVQSPLSPTTI